MTLRMGLGVGLLFVSVGLAAQPTLECSTTKVTVDLEVPDPEEHHFFWTLTNHVVFLRPDAVLEFWTSSIYADESWARLVSERLPLRQDQDLAKLFNDRILPVMVASLIHAGTAAILANDGYLNEVIVEETSGPPCNSSRRFLEPDENETPILRIIDFMQ